MLRLMDTSEKGTVVLILHNQNIWGGERVKKSLEEDHVCSCLQHYTAVALPAH